MLKEVKSCTKRLNEHKEKLEQYMKNPDKFDNKNFLQNASSPEQRSRIITGRISHLNREIDAFKNRIDRIIKELEYRRIK